MATTDETAAAPAEVLGAWANAPAAPYGHDVDDLLIHSGDVHTTCPACQYQAEIAKVMEAARTVLGERARQISLCTRAHVVVSDGPAERGCPWCSPEYSWTTSTDCTCTGWCGHSDCGHSEAARWEAIEADRAIAFARAEKAEGRVAYWRGRLEAAWTHGDKLANDLISAVFGDDQPAELRQKWARIAALGEPRVQRRAAVLGSPWAYETRVVCASEWEPAEESGADPCLVPGVSAEASKTPPTL